MSCCVQVYTGVCPSYDHMVYLPKCDSVAQGALCDGDGECGTDNAMNNCQTWDVYTRVACDSPPPPSPPPLPPPPVPCPSNQVWQDCGAVCNATCATPTPVCAQVCQQRCECPLETPIWHDHLQTCGTTAQCQAPVAEPGSGELFAQNPCAAYLETSDESANATGWFHTGLPQLSMFTNNRQSCCDACNNINAPGRDSTPSAPPPPNDPPQGSVRGMLRPSDTCHAIEVGRSLASP